MHGRRYLCAGGHLADQESDAGVGDEREERVGRLGVLEQPRLGFLEGLARATLDHVGHERPGCAAEADEGDAAREAVAGEGDGVVHVLEAFADAIGLEVLHVFGDVEGFGEDGAGVHEDLHAKGLGDDEDVGEDDGGIKLWIAVDGLQGDLCRELWILAYLKKVVFLAKLSKLCGRCWKAAWGDEEGDDLGDNGPPGA